MQDPPPEPCLYGYWRSSAAYRVRIALNLKRITARQVSVRLQLGEQTRDEHRARSPAGLVPVWRDPDGFTLAQSLAIIDYLDEIYPDPPLLPNDPRQKALCREIAYTIACDIHPIGNLRVLEKLTADYGAGASARAAWNRHWIGIGFGALEARLATISGRHAVGDQITLADICLVPQVYNARRAGLDLTPYPGIAAADGRPASRLPSRRRRPKLSPMRHSGFGRVARAPAFSRAYRHNAPDRQKKTPVLMRQYATLVATRGTPGWPQPTSSPQSERENGQGQGLGGGR